MINLEWIAPANLKDNWETIKEGLQKVADTTDAWIIEDIYMSIKMGTCNLHLVYDDVDYKGFIVTQQQDNYGTVSIHVWAAYSNGHDFNILSESTDTIKQWGKAVNAKEITFSTTRKGWARTALKLGYEPTLTTYRLKL